MWEEEGQLVRIRTPEREREAGPLERDTAAHAAAHLTRHDTERLGGQMRR